MSAPQLAEYESVKTGFCVRWFFIKWFCIPFTSPVALLGGYVNCRRDLGFAAPAGPPGTEPFASAERPGRGATHAWLWATAPASPVVAPAPPSQRQCASVPVASTSLPALGGVV